MNQDVKDIYITMLNSIYKRNDTIPALPFLRMKNSKLYKNYKTKKRKTSHDQRD